VVAVVPWDEALAEAERLGRALLDHAPDAPAVRVLESMVDRLDRDRLERERP
jgi:Flp pilus assembly CpaE family ATPase